MHGSRHSRDHAGRRTVNTGRVDQCSTLDEIFRPCLPAFGGAQLRRVYTVLDNAIGMGCPLTVSIAGPVTVSGQHQTWLIPLLETGRLAYISTTGAVRYHDGHRSLDGQMQGPIHEVPIWGDGRALRDEGIRVSGMSFDQQVLLDQDRFLTAVLARPEFQRKMTGSELRYLLAGAAGDFGNRANEPKTLPTGRPGPAGFASEVAQASACGSAANAVKERMA